MPTMFTVDGTVQHALIPPDGTGLVIALGSEPDQWSVESLGQARSWWVETPPPARTKPLPAVARAVHDVRRMTGWSNRKLATVAGTSHPTIAAIAHGRVPSRSPEVAERLLALHDLVFRLWQLVHEDPYLLSRLLDDAQEDEKSAAEYIAEGSSARAYLTAIGKLRKPRGVAGLMGSDRRRRHGDDSVALHDDDAE